MREPGRGRLLSGAEVRMTIQPVPLLFGSVKLPENVAPAARVMVLPGWAALSAAWKSPPAGTATVLPACATKVVSRYTRGSSGLTVTWPKAKAVKAHHARRFAKHALVMAVFENTVTLHFRRRLIKLGLCV